MVVYLDAIWTLTMLGALWVFTCWLYRDYRNDAFRQELFALRDRLFDMARRGQIDFNSPAYGMLRGGINNLLLSAEHVSFIGTLMLMGVRDVAWRERGKRIGREWSENLSSLDKDVAQELTAIRGRVDARLLEHMALTSPLFQVTVAPLLIVLLAGFLLRRLGGAAKAHARSTAQRVADGLGVDALTLSDEGPCEESPSGAPLHA